MRNGTNSAGNGAVARENGNHNGSETAGAAQPSPKDSPRMVPLNNSTAKTDTNIHEDVDEPETTELLCVCRKPYDPRKWMISCDRCNQWFHGTCIGVPEEAGSLAVYFYCEECRDKYGVRSTWKPKCRLADCWRPARVDDQPRSKYCCDDHGIKFFNLSAENVFGASRSELANFVNSAKKKEDLELEPSKPLSDPQGNETKGPADSSDKCKEIETRLSSLAKAVELAAAQSLQIKNETGKATQICGFNPDWIKLGSPDQVDLEKYNREMCRNVAAKCSQHASWPIIAERRLELEEKRLLGAPLPTSNGMLAAPLGITRYTKDGIVYFKQHGTIESSAK